MTTSASLATILAHQLVSVMPDQESLEMATAQTIGGVLMMKSFQEPEVFLAEVVRIVIDNMDDVINRDLFVAIMKAQIA